jgi:hypothetical protein
MRASIYVRVSTASKTKQADAATFVQNPGVQEQPLRELASQRGWAFGQNIHARRVKIFMRRAGST